MGRMAKYKGKRGEYEFADILGRAIEGKVIVNPHAQKGDIQAIPGLSIEVKRQETLVVNTWWRQAVKQAEIEADIPVLAYRKNRGKWRVCLPAYLLTIKAREGYIEMDLEVFLTWLREDYLGEVPKPIV